MRTVSVSELKARLSQYLREVRRGGEIQVLDRGVPVARLTQLVASSSHSDEELHRQRLISAGAIRPGSGKVATILRTSPLKLPVSIRTALDDDRADRL